MKLLMLMLLCSCSSVNLLKTPKSRSLETSWWDFKPEVGKVYTNECKDSPMGNVRKCEEKAVKNLCDPNDWVFFEKGNKLIVPEESLK